MTPSLRPIPEQAAAPALARVPANRRRQILAPVLVREQEQKTTTTMMAMMAMTTGTTMTVTKGYCK